MRKAGVFVAAVAVAVAATGCSSGSGGDGKGSSVAYGAQSCSDWTGRLSSDERWDAAEELLVQAKATDGTEGDRAPATSSIKAFEQGLTEACDSGSSDDLLASVADDLYSANAAFYSY